MPEFPGKSEQKIEYFLFIFEILWGQPPPPPPSLGFFKNLLDTLDVSEIKIYSLLRDRVSKSHFYAAKSKIFRYPPPLPS